MSENKDLEITKTNVIFMQQCENTCEAGMQEAFENIICAAERMAAELATAKENELKALNEIGRLKAELAKRPEVVFCKDCRAMQKGDQIDPERLTCVHGAIVEPYDFCSRGQAEKARWGNEI